LQISDELRSGDRYTIFGSHSERFRWKAVFDQKWTFLLVLLNRRIFSIEEEQSGVVIFSRQPAFLK